MLKRLREAQLIWPSLMTLAALGVLISLGTWQVQRKVWKDGLIASIQARVGEPPVALEEPADAWITLGEQEYRPVLVTGRFRHGDERHLFAVENGEPGWHVLTPLETARGHIVLVNRGFVPEALKDAAKRTAGQVEGPVTMVGLVRHADTKGTFEPDPDLKRNMWFWRDLPAMAASVGLAGADKHVLPFLVDARAEPANLGGWPRGGTTRLEISNRHLEYVLTWYGLAVTLLAVFLAYAVPRLR
ncbi:MAG: SURF1 family protein [Hyphomicrobium sp.]|jgi:surfeit locus 1 family protein